LPPFPPSPLPLPRLPLSTLPPPHEHRFCCYCCLMLVDCCVTQPLPLFMPPLPAPTIATAGC
jgi:hypothetical protein